MPVDEYDTLDALAYMPVWHTCLEERYRPLSVAEETIVTNAVAPVQTIPRQHLQDVMGSSGWSGLTRKTMAKLSPRVWLNDDLVNYMLQLVNARDDRFARKRRTRSLERLTKILRLWTSFPLVLNRWLYHPEGPRGRVIPKGWTGTGAVSAVHGPYVYDAVPIALPTCRLVWCASSFLLTRMMKNGYDSVKNWSRKAKFNSKHDIFALFRVVLPVNISNGHWAGVHVDFINREIIYYDSMGGNGREWLQLVYTYLQGEWDQYHTSQFSSFGDWTMISRGTSIPQQMNGDDCGVFLIVCIIFATSIVGNTLGIPLMYQQMNMPYFRRRIAKDLLQGRLD